MIYDYGQYYGDNGDQSNYPCERRIILCAQIFLHMHALLDFLPYALLSAIVDTVAIGFVLRRYQFHGDIILLDWFYSSSGFYGGYR